MMSLKEYELSCMATAIEVNKAVTKCNRDAIGDNKNDVRGHL